LLSIIAAASVLSERARAAGAAHAVDTAEVSEPGACKVESWVSTASNRDMFAATTPTCVVNVFRPVELSAQLIRARRRWMDEAPKIKTNLVPTAIGSWDIALSDNVWTLTAEVFGQLGARQEAIGVIEPRFRSGCAGVRSTTSAWI
jgi:hypothetical protein